MASGSATKPQRIKVDYDNVILALPSVFPPPPKKKRPRAAGGKGARASQKTTKGQRKNSKAAPNDKLAKGQRKNHKAATRVAVTIGCSSGVATNSVNDEHSIQEYMGTMEQQNSGNSEDILEDSKGLSKAPSIVNNEQHIPKEQSGDPDAGLLLLANAGEDILTWNPADFAEELNAANNEQHILQAGPWRGRG